MPGTGRYACPREGVAHSSFAPKAIRVLISVLWREDGELGGKTLVLTKGYGVVLVRTYHEG